MLRDGAVLVVTPNMANPLMRAAAAVPQRVRVALKRFGPRVEARDVFPAPYRANTVALERLLPAHRRSTLVALLQPVPAERCGA